MTAINFKFIPNVRSIENLNTLKRKLSLPELFFEKNITQLLKMKLSERMNLTVVCISHKENQICVVL